MDVLSVKSVCDEYGEKLSHEVKQILFAKRNVAEIEDLGLSFVLYILITIKYGRHSSASLATCSIRYEHSHGTQRHIQYLTL